METNKLIAGIVAAAIAIIVLAGVLMPALSNATKTTDTLTNEGYFNVSLIDENTDVTITWDHTDPKKITIGTNAIDLSNVPVSLPITLVGTDKAIVRYEDHSNGNTYIYYNGNGGQKVINSSGSEDATIVLTDTSFSGTFGTTERTATITNGIYADPNGTYIMKDKDVPCYLKDDSIIIAGLTRLTGTTETVGVFGVGNVEDGMTINNIVTQSVTLGEVTMNYESSTDYVDTYILSSIQFEITDSNEVSTLATYTYFAVPEEIVSERSVHLTDAMNVILNVIPLLIIVSVLLGVVAVFILRRE